MSLTLFADACRDGNSSESKFLVKFIQAADPGNTLNLSYGHVPDCCSVTWPGINCDKFYHDISEIRLDNMKLGGTFDADSLCKLPSLRVLSLGNNFIHGVVPDAISNCLELTFLNLSSTMLHGELPNSILQLKNLKTLDVSHTNITCAVPTLTESKYEDKGGSTVSNKWRIPPTEYLPLLLALAFIAIVVLYASRKAWKSSEVKEIEEIIPETPTEKLPICTEEGDEQNGEHINLVFFCEKYKRFCTDDLLKSAADLQGQNFYSTLYKVKLTDSTTFAVKRLRNLQVSEDEFRRKFILIGKLEHPNLLPLVALNSSENEKLLIYAYQRRGSLSSLLSSYVKRKRDFPWRQRLTIMCGIARGLDYLARESCEENPAHGNLKPSNIILSDTEEPLISEFGVWGLLDPKRTFLYSSNGYRAPEKRLTKEADIFSFGIILLELLTGKIVERGTLNLPKWVKSMVREEWTGEVFDKEVGKAGKRWAFPLLNIALKCVSDLPEQRPGISEVLEKIEIVVNSQEDQSFSSTSSIGSSPPDHDLIHSVIPETGETPRIFAE